MSELLSTSTQRLEVSPALGGAIRRWDWQATDGNWHPMLRRATPGSSDLYEMGCFPLLPWANRVGHGGFEHAGRAYPLTPNRRGEPYPIHGDAWLQPWQVRSRTSSRLALSLVSARFQGSPYHFEACQVFELLPDGLRIDLSVTHCGNAPLPYGIGLHPYFDGGQEVWLRAGADGVWISEASPLPDRHDSAIPADWDYRAPRRVAGQTVDHCFTGWDGQAVLAWPQRGLQLTLSTAPSPGYFQLYRPTGQSFICLEPVSHPIDAFHLPGQPGLTVLEQGASLAMTTWMTVAALPPGEMTFRRASDQGVRK